MSKIEEVFNKLKPLKIFRYYIGKEVAIGFIQGILQKTNINDVYWMIENDEYNLFNGHPKADVYVRRVRKLLGENRDVVVKVVTKENILEIVREIRPDIYSLIINHRKGVEWVENTIEECLNYLLSPK